MPSAYNILGVPRHASASDIEAAFEHAKKFYTSDKLAADAQHAQRFAETVGAYQLLSDPARRAAHDRQLDGQPTAVRPAAAAHSRAPKRGGWNPLVLIGLFAAIVLCGGLGLQYQRQAAKAEAAEMARRAQAEAEQREKDERQRREAQAIQQERELRRDADAAVARSQVAQAQQQRLDNQRFEAQRREEDRLAAESRRRVAADRARIRELCWLNYRKHDC